MSDVTELEKPAQADVVGPAELLRHAINNGADLDRLEKLMAMQERDRESKARLAFIAAMVDFKKSAPKILKDKNVLTETGSYDHATLGSICEAATEALAIRGITHDWDMVQPDSGMIGVKCTLTHLLGHSQTTTMEAPPDNTGRKNGVQQIGSTVTYLERYTLLGACGLAPKGADDDGRAAGAGAVASASPLPAKSAPAATTAADASPELVSEAKAAAKKGLAAYQKFWLETGYANRTALMPHHETCKADAVAIDRAAVAAADEKIAAPRSPEMAALAAQIGEAADAGVEVFDRAWSSLSPETQDALAGDLPAMNARAAAAGARP